MVAAWVFDSDDDEVDEAALMALGDLDLEEEDDASEERRYLLKEFPELASCGECSTVLEIGCGNGSTALAILKEELHGNKSISLYACDCSKEALERAKENIEAANINLAKECF
ncbi:hypothetical protein CQW23_28021 [Capsicum baccatum]|uniref:Methyltransferase domain-containing protein n=1 Tax=Capsicum baccatum TaxID=33114 RepID=A0A2G2VFD2_CAPBA|nr:hypothetical protein CQW23_28021 [Capsicum baccatum]